MLLLFIFNVNIINAMLLTSAILILVGFIVGIMGAVLGIGGGIIIVPILVILLDIPIHNAIAVSLVVIIANSLSTSAVYIKNGMANIPVGLIISLVAVISAMIGSSISVVLDQYIVMLILGCVQLSVSALIYIRMRITKPYIELKDDDKDYFFAGSYIDKATGKQVSYKPIRLKLTALLSIFAGLFSGLAGVGGGIMMIPTMNIVSFMPIKAATATSAFVIGFTATAAAIIYIGAGYMEPMLVANIIIGISLGTYFSMKFLTSLTDKKVSYAFIILLIIVSANMIYKGIVR